MVSEKDYVVIAGNHDRPATIQRGEMEKGMGQTVFVERGVSLTRPADIGFPNRTEAWGTRVVRDEKGKIVKRGVDVKDDAYKGEIEFLKWGKDGGSLIVCRYLKGYQTLDYLFQNIVLNAAENIRDDNEGSADSFFIRLQSGENVFNEITDAMLIQYLKIHDYNGDSLSKSPNRLMSMFKEKHFEQIEEKIDFSLDAKFDSLSLVKNAADDNSGAKLRNLFNIVKNITEAGEIMDNETYAFLKKLADSKPDAFIGAVNKWKLEISDTFEKAKVWKMLDLTKDGIIAAGKDKFEIIAEGIDAKGEGMLDWCLTNFIDPIAFECFFKLKKLTDKIK